MAIEYTESVSGFKVVGSWIKIVEHGERITYALEQLDAESSDMKEWNNWRPKSTERLSHDVCKKTSNTTSIDENDREREVYKPVRKDFLNAGKELNQCIDNIREPKEFVGNLKTSIELSARALSTFCRKTVREFEELIYEHIMTSISPYYFDNKLVSANISRKSKEPPIYEFEVNINDDDIKSKVSHKLNDYQDEFDRWHVSSDSKLENIKEFEGIETKEGLSENNEDTPNPNIN